VVAAPNLAKAEESDINFDFCMSINLVPHDRQGSTGPNHSKASNSKTSKTWSHYYRIALRVSVILYYDLEGRTRKNSQCGRPAS